MLARRPRVWVAAGQDIEHSGPGEAFLPVLSALGRLGQGARRRTLARTLARHAPTWLLELPALAAAEDEQALRRAAQGASYERMLRELAEALTAHRTLILVLEDLQWSDTSTLDLIALLARRSVAARVLVIGTHRPVDADGGAHALPSLVRELAMHGKCAELPLCFLDESEVAAYLSARLALDDPDGLAVLARAVHERTEGNPLFVVNVVEDVLGDALDRAHVAPREAAERVRASVPANLRQAIEAPVHRLPEEEQRVLEAASVVGVELSAAALAAGLEADVGEVQCRCATLVRCNLLIEPRGHEAWPDGTVSARYGFVHALYQSVLYERLGPARRRALHRRVAERLERGHAARRPTSRRCAPSTSRRRTSRRARSLIATSFGDDPAVVCLSHTAMALWFLGHPDQALERSEEALACARETGLPQSLVFPLNYATWCRLLRREPELARPQAEERLAIATRSEFAYWVAQATAVHGWVLLDTGDLERGTVELGRGIEAYEAIGAQLLRPWHVARLAEAYGAGNRTGERLALLEELRAALSLARLDHRKDGTDDARAALEQVVARFDEGLETGDLRAARAFLDNR